MFLELYGFAFAGEGSDLYAPAAAALTVLFFRVAPHLIPKFAGELEDVGRNVCWKESSAFREDSVEDRVSGIGSSQRVRAGGEKARRQS